MDKFNQKIILILSLVILVGFICSNFASAQRGLEIRYPEIPGVGTPTEKTTLPEYIKYVFNLSVMIAGILAFAMLVYGGISYLISAGSPVLIGEAKSRMAGGFMGLILLLISWLVLTTINPELTIFREMTPLGPTEGIYLINAEGEKRHYVTDTPNIKDFQAEKILFISSPEELSSVFLFRDKNMEAKIPGDIAEIKNDDFYFNNRIPAPIPDVLLFPESPKSISFLWNKPGVYLYEKTDFGITLREPLYLPETVSNLGDWDNKAKSIKIKDPSNGEYRVILFTEPKFKDTCTIIFESTENLDVITRSGYRNNNPPIGNSKVSSLAVYLAKSDKPLSGNVVFYEETSFGGGKIKVEAVDIPEGYSYYFLKWKGSIFDNGKPWKERILSFEINGPFGVLLTTKEESSVGGVYSSYGKCQFFIESQSNLKLSYVYSPVTTPGADKVREVIIIPLPQ